MSTQIDHLLNEDRRFAPSEEFAAHAIAKPDIYDQPDRLEFWANQARELLTWQTAALLERETHRDGIVVHVRPELVVEIALDGVQASTRYAGGVALRFARVKAYRPDKAPADADTIEAVQAIRTGG